MVLRRMSFGIIAGALLIAVIAMGCDCGKPIDPPLPPGQVRMSLSLRTPSFQRFARLRNVQLTIEVPGKDPVVKRFDRLLLGRPLVVDMVVPGDKALKIKAEGVSWDGKSKWGGQWSFALPIAKTDHIGVLTVGKDGKTDQFLPLLFASGSKEDSKVRFWTLPPQGAKTTPKIEWKGDVTFSTDERKGDPTKDPASKDDTGTSQSGDFRIRDADLLKNKAPTIRIDYKSEGKDVDWLELRWNGKDNWEHKSAGNLPIFVKFLKLPSIQITQGEDTKFTLEIVNPKKKKLFISWKDNCGGTFVEEGEVARWTAPNKETDCAIDATVKDKYDFSTTLRKRLTVIATPKPNDPPPTNPKLTGTFAPPTIDVGVPQTYKLAIEDKAALKDIQFFQNCAPQSNETITQKPGDDDKTNVTITWFLKDEGRAFPANCSLRVSVRNEKGGILQFEASAKVRYPKEVKATIGAAGGELIAYHPSPFFASVVQRAGQAPGNANPTLGIGVVRMHLRVPQGTLTQEREFRLDATAPGSGVDPKMMILGRLFPDGFKTTNGSLAFFFFPPSEAQFKVGDTFEHRFRKDSTDAFKKGAKDFVTKQDLSVEVQLTGFSDHAAFAKAPQPEPAPQEPNAEPPTVQDDADGGNREPSQDAADGGDGGSVDDVTPEPTTPQIQIATQFKRKGDEGIVFIVPDGENPADFSATSTCGSEFRRETRNGKTVIILVVSTIPAKPTCKVTINKNGRFHKSVTIPYGFDNDQSDNPNRVRQLINGLLQEITISYTNGNFMPKPINHRAQARNYRIVTSGSNFTAATPQRFNTTDFKTGTLAWNPVSLKQKLLDHTATFTRVRVRCSVTNIDNANGTLEVNTEGFDLTTLSRQRLTQVLAFDAAGKIQLNVVNSTRIRIEMATANTIKFTPIDRFARVDLTKVQVGSSVDIRFVPLDAKGNKDELRFTIGDTEIDAKLTLNAPVLDWKEGVDYPNAAWLTKNLFVSFDIFRAEPPRLKPHELEFTTKFQQRLSNGKDPNAAKNLYPTLKIGLIAAMERWYCVRKLKGLQTNKTTPLTLIPLDLLVRSDAFSFLNLKKFSDPRSVFFSQSAAERFISLMTWGGMYPGNKTLLPLDEPDCTDYTNGKLPFKISSQSKETLDARTVIDLLLMDEVRDSNSVPIQFPDTCRGNNAPGNCTQFRRSLPMPKWHQALATARYFGLGEAYVNAFGPGNTDDDPFCQMKNHWTNTKDVTFEPGSRCRYNHPAGAFDVTRSILGRQFDEWLFSMMVGRTPSTPKAKAWDTNISCSSRAVNALNLCPDKAPSSDVIFARAQGSYIGSLSIGTPRECSSAFDNEKIKEIRELLRKNPSLPPIQQPCDTVNNMLRNSDLETLARIVLGNFMPGNAPPNPQKLMRNCYTTRTRSRVVNGRRETCNQYDFKSLCGFAGPRISAPEPNLTCKSGPTYHHELPIHDLRFKIAANACESAERFFFTYWQYCQFHHMTRGGSSKPSDDFIKGYPVDDRVRCDQYDFNQNNRLDREDALWYFNLMHQAVRKTQASYVQIFSEFYKQPYPAKMLNQIEPHVKAHIEDALKQILRPGRGFDIGRLMSTSAMKDIRTKNIPSTLADGSFPNITSYTRNQIFAVATVSVLWKQIAAFHKNEPNKWMELLIRLQRTGTTGSNSQPKAVTFQPNAKRNIVLPVMCAMVIAGRGPNDTKNFQGSNGGIRDIDVTIDKWAKALSGSISTTSAETPGIYGGTDPGDLSFRNHRSGTPGNSLVGSPQVSGHGFSAGQGVLRARVDNQVVETTASIFAKGLFAPLRHRPMLQPRPQKDSDVVPASPIEITSRFDNDPINKDEPVTLEPLDGLTLDMTKAKVTAFFGNQQRIVNASATGKGLSFTVPKGADRVTVAGLGYKGLHEHLGGAIRLAMKTQERTQQIVNLLLAPAPRTSPLRGAGRYRHLTHGVRWHHDGSITMARRLAQLKGFGQIEDFSLHYSSQRRAFDQALNEYLNAAQDETTTSKQGLAGGVQTGAGWGHSWDYRLLPFFDGASVTYVLVTPYGVTILVPTTGLFDPKGSGPFFFRPAQLVQTAKGDATWLASLVVKLDASGTATMEDKDGHIWTFAASGLLKSRALFGHGATLEFSYSGAGLIVEQKGKKGGSDVTGWRLSLDQSESFVRLSVNAQGMPTVQGSTLHFGAAQTLTQIAGDDGSIWSFSHSDDGPMSTISNPAKGSLSLSFDSQQRLISASITAQQSDKVAISTTQGITAPTSRTFKGSFTYAANQTTYTDFIGRKYTYALDAKRRITSLKVSQGGNDITMATYNYFKSGNLDTLLVTALTDHDANRFSWKYNTEAAKDDADLFFTDKKSGGARGHWILLTEVITPGGTRTITHASGLELGLVNTVKNPWGTTTFAYKDRLIVERRAPDRTTKFTRDATGAKAVQGQLLSEEDLREKRKTCYLYETDTSKGGNSIGQPSATIIGEPGNCPATPTNNATQRTYAMTYNAAGHVLTRQDPFSGGTTTMERLADGRVTSHKGVVTWSRAYFGPALQAKTRMGKTQNTTFSSFMTPSTTRYSVSGGNRCRQHIVDPMGRIVAIVGTTGDISVFAYDAVDRVILRRYPTDVRASLPCDLNTEVLLSQLKDSKASFTQNIAYGPNSQTTTQGDVQIIQTYGWFLDGKRRMLTQAHLEKSGSSFAPVRQLFQLYDGRGLLAGIGEYGHTKGQASPLQTRACVPSGAQALPTSISVGGGQLALFNERYIARDGQGWITQICNPNGGRIEWPYDPRNQEQKIFQGSNAILTKALTKDTWGRTIAWKRGGIEVRRILYDKDGGVTGQAQVYQEQRLDTKANKLFTYQTHTMDAQGRLASRQIVDAAGKALEDIAYTYDPAGRLEKTIHTDKGSGRIRTITKAWTDEGALMQEVTTTSTQKGVGASKDNQVVTVKTDELGRENERVVRRFGIVVQHATRSYHGWGKIAQLTLPMRRVTRRFTYDASGRVASATSFNDKENLPIGELTWRYPFSEVQLQGALLDAPNQTLGTKAQAMDYTLDYAGRPLQANGPNRTFHYRYDARGNLICKSVRVIFGNQVAGGRWDATYDTLSRRTTLKVAPFVKNTDVAHCGSTGPSNTTQDLRYTYDAAGYLADIKGTLDSKQIARNLTYHANGLLKREALTIDGFKQPSQIEYVYSPHGLLESVGFKASMPSTNDALTDISSIQLSYGTNNAWWSQRSHAELEIKEYKGFLRYNRIGDTRDDLGARHRVIAQRILGKGFEIIEQKLNIPRSQPTGKDFTGTAAKVDNSPQVRLDIARRYDDHGRMLTRERLLYVRAKEKDTGEWPFDDNGQIRNLFGIPFKIINNGKFESRQLRDMFSCTNTLDTYRQSIATGISPKHPHFKSIEDPSVSFKSVADTQEFLTTIGSWGVPLRRSCENVIFDANGARPIGLHQRLLFFLPQFWLSKDITSDEDRGRLGLYQLMGKKTFVYDARNQLTRMEVAGMLFEAGGSGPFAPVHEWNDNSANIAGSHRIEYPGKVGNFGNLHFTHHRYWHSPRVLGGMLGWAFPESRENRAPMLVAKANAAPTVEVRGSLASSLYDPAGRLFAAFNPPSTIPDPVDFSKVAFQFTNRPASEQQQLTARYKQTYIQSHQHRLHVTLQLGEHKLARIDKAWFGNQASEISCPTKNESETMHCVFDHHFSHGAGHLRFRTGRVFHPLRFDATLDGTVLHVSVVDADSQPFHGMSIGAGGQRLMYLDRDQFGHADLAAWEGMMGFRSRNGLSQLQNQSGMALAEALRPARLGHLAAYVHHGQWSSPLSHATPILARINLPTLAPYRLDQHAFQISLDQTIQIWSQVIQREQNFIRDVLAEAQGTITQLSIGLGIATVALPFLAPALQGSLTALAALRGTIIALELAQVALVAAEVAAVVQSEGIHQLSFMQTVMLLSGILSTVIAARVGLPANRLLGFQRFAAKAEIANTVIGASMVTALVIDGISRGFNETHATQAAFFAGASVFSSTMGRFNGRFLARRKLSPDTTRYMKSNGAQRLHTLKTRYKQDPPHIITQRLEGNLRRIEFVKKQRLELQLQSKRWGKMSFVAGRNALRKGHVQGPIKQGVLKHRVGMQAEVHKLGTELLAFLTKHQSTKQGKLFVTAKGQLDLELLVGFLKQKDPTRHANLSTADPAMQQMFKTVAGKIQKEVTDIGKAKGIDDFSQLNTLEQSAVVRRAMVQLKEQLNTMIHDGNTPAGWKKAFNDKADSLGKDVIKHAIGKHAKQAQNKQFYFNGKTAEDFWNGCNRKWVCVKDAYEAKRLNPEEMYLMREFRLKETRNFINDAAKDLGLCKDPKQCSEVVFAPPAGSDGPTSDYDISWTVLRADGTTDMAASAALIGHATRKYIAKIGQNAETAFEHGLFLPPPAFVKELNKLSLQLQKTKPQIPDALAFFIRNLDPSGANPTKAIADMTTELNAFGAPGLTAQINQSRAKFTTFTGVTDGSAVFKALEDFITCSDAKCTARDRTVWNGLFVDGNNKLLTNPTIDPITLGLKKHITGCTNAACSDGPGQTAWKTKFFDETNNKLRPNGEAVIKDFMGSLIADQLSQLFAGLKIPGPGATAAEIQTFNTTFSKIIDLDTQLKFLQPESYGTVSTLVHIVEGIQKGKNITGTDLLGSFFENMGYERHYTQLNKAKGGVAKGDKIQKYGIRVADALKRMVETDSRLVGVYTDTEVRKINAIFDRMGNEHKTNADSSFANPKTLNNLKKDMTDLYTLAGKAMKKLFP